MLESLIVLFHVGGAVGALITGMLAFIFPNGTPRHRLIGKLYLLMWAMIAVTAFWLGLDTRLSPFEIATTFGVYSTARAYWMVLRHKELGRIWLQRHYNYMLGSMAGLLVATANQLLPRLGIEYPVWVFVLMCISPAFVIPLIRARLDRRYGFEKRVRVAKQPA